MSEGSNYRSTHTGRYRFALKSRWFKDPVIILQAEKKVEEYKTFFMSPSKWVEIGKNWHNVNLEHLSTMSLSTLLEPKEAGELPICFAPRRSMFGWQLVLMVYDGAYQHNSWRPARLQDLTLKDGKISGGLGLMSRN